ncbi:MAG: hypothetical protein IPJ76_07020 [Flavobacteriales bacterium]|nr:MAG: hypothetical protein IPJ76_07020 [Flavobacteriales bacterium]
MRPYSILFGALLLAGCAQERIQVFNTASVRQSLSPDQWVFESDSVVVSYSFYASEGVMAFSVYNTSSRPLYIDWKKSSFIYNGAKYDYWESVEVSQASTTGTMQGVSAQSLDWGWMRSSTIASYGFSSSSTASVSRRAQQVVFVPPHSYLDHAQFKLYPSEQFAFNKAETKVVKESRSDKPKALTSVAQQEFDQSNSPLRFRNYLAIGWDENVSNPVFIDHEFWLSSVREMELRHFRGKSTGFDDKGERQYPRPFRTKKSFYIKLQ